MKRKKNQSYTETLIWTHFLRGNKWRIEAVDAEGHTFGTTFSGPNAKQRSLDYVAWKRGGHQNT